MSGARKAQACRLLHNELNDTVKYAEPRIWYTVAKKTRLQEASRAGFHVTNKGKRYQKGAEA
ncbi:hypothetical protein GCM10020370_35480 [Paenibacillus hodogayensis]